MEYWLDELLGLLALGVPLAVVSALIVGVMVRLGPADRPNARSAHTRPVPKGGGLGPVVVTLAGVGLASRYPSALHGYGPSVAGAIIVAAVALLDDLRNWPFTVKLAAQATGAALVVGSGVSIDSAGSVPLGPLGPILSFCWIMYVTNAVNFMDGLNGLAAGTCAIAGLAFSFGTNSGTGPVGLALAAGLAGFLPFNYPRARIFMGDVGSQFCGFVLAVLALIETQAPHPHWLIVPLALLVLLFDVAATLVRRLLAGERLTEAHRGHAYQLLHRCGVPAAWVTAMVWTLSAWGALCAAWASWYVAIPLALAPVLLWTAWAWRRARTRLENW